MCGLKDEGIEKGIIVIESRVVPSLQGSLETIQI